MMLWSRRATVRNTPFMSMTMSRPALDALPDESVQLHISSVPYNVGKKYGSAVGADARSILTQKADLVIGQPAGDLFRAVVNYPNGDPDLPTRTGLYRPVGVAIDDGGNLWVADSGNGRSRRQSPDEAREASCE